jgi:hypothetical protein
MRAQRSLEVAFAWYTARMKCKFLALVPAVVAMACAAAQKQPAVDMTRLQVASKTTANVVARTTPFDYVGQSWMRLPARIGN